jgi:uncharacterized membrane protein YbhN (UPF0104 family)
MSMDLLLLGAGALLLFSAAILLWSIALLGRVHHHLRALRARPEVTRNGEGRPLKERL